MKKFKVGDQVVMTYNGKKIFGNSKLIDKTMVVFRVKGSLMDLTHKDLPRPSMDWSQEFWKLAK